jgi:hypothetical protein
VSTELSYYPKSLTLDESYAVSAETGCRTGTSKKPRKT